MSDHRHAALRTHSPTTRKSRKDPSKCPNSPNCMSEEEEFVIYSGSNVRVFFNDSLPQSVSEACLVNDHFILVKLPISDMRRERTQCREVPVADAALIPPVVVTQPVLPLVPVVEISESSSVEQTPLEITSALQNMSTLEPQEYHGKTNIVRFLRATFTRKITPIQEVSHSSSENTTITSFQSSDNHANLRVKAKRLIRSCWQADGRIEAFDNKTSLHGPLLNAMVSHREPESVDQLSNEASRSDDVSVENQSKTELSSNACAPLAMAKLQEPKHSTSDHFRVKREIEVELEHRGQLIVVDETDGGCGAGGESVPMRTNESRRRLKLKWFHKVTQPKQSKQKKKKLHAIVQKNYFVHWTKPPETKWNGYGTCRCTSVNTVPIIRRCRSALF